MSMRAADLSHHSVMGWEPKGEGTGASSQALETMAHGSAVDYSLISVFQTSRRQSPGISYLLDAS